LRKTSPVISGYFAGNAGIWRESKRERERERERERGTRENAGGHSQRYSLMRLLATLLVHTFDVFIPLTSLHTFDVTTCPYLDVTQLRGVLCKKSPMFVGLFVKKRNILHENPNL